MAGRAPPQSLSIPSFSPNQQGSGSGGSDSFRTRGRNRSSGGSSGASSRDHSVESRSERRGVGNTDFRGSRGGSWGNQFSDPRGDGDARGFEGRGWGSSPKGISKWGSGADSPDWRANRQVLPETDTRNGSGRGIARGFGSDRRARLDDDRRRPEGRGNYGRGNPQGSNSWVNESQKRGSGRFGGSKDSLLDSPTPNPTPRGRSSNRGIKKHNDGRRQPGRNSGWGNNLVNENLEKNRSGETNTDRDGWIKYSNQDARVVENNEERFQDKVVSEFHSSISNDEEIFYDKEISSSIPEFHPNEGNGHDKEIPSSFSEFVSSGEFGSTDQGDTLDKEFLSSLAELAPDDEGNLHDEKDIPSFPSQGFRTNSDGNVHEEDALKTLLSPGLRTIGEGNSHSEVASISVPSPGRRISIDSKAQSDESPRTPASQGLRADAEEFNPETARLGLIKIPQIVSLRAEAAEYNPETPKDPASPMTRRSTDWYEICLEEEEEEDRQALENQKRGDALGPPSLNSPSGGRGEFTRRKSGLSRNTSGKKLDEISSNRINGPTPSKKEFARRNSFGSRTPNGKKREDTFLCAPKGELRRAGSFGGRDVVGDIQSPNSSRGRLGRNKSFNRDLLGDSAVGSQIPGSPGSAKGEFKPWNSVREDAVDVAQPSRSNTQRNGELRSPSRGDKYVPLALRNKGRSDSSNLKPSTDSPHGRKSGDPGNYASPREENGRWRKGNDEPVSGSPAAVDTEDSVNSVTESFDQKNVNTAVRPAAFFRALNEGGDGGEHESLPHIVGTCPDMCPVKERLQRERLRDLAVFERVNGDLKRTSKELAVKKFCRTVVASELSQSDVRPLPVLWRTLQYLLGLLDDPEFPFDIVHNFLFDRTRAIRQELGMQRIRDPQSVTIHEEVVRFHILSQHELLELNRKRSKQIDTHLNLQQLSKSLYSLLNLYISLGGEDGVQFENEAEFHAYYVLLNLGNHGQFQAEPLSLWLPNVPAVVLHAPPMQFARKVLRCYRSNNFVGFFRLVKEATYLQACLMELSFDALRATSLAMLNVAEYKRHPFPLLELGELLLLEENQAEELCTYYGLLTGLEKGSEQLCLFVKQSDFTVPERTSLPTHSSPLIDSKRAPSLFQQVKAHKIEK